MSFWGQRALTGLLMAGAGQGFIVAGLVLACCGASALADGPANDGLLWTPADAGDTARRADTWIQPTRYQAVWLDVDLVADRLAAAPAEAEAERLAPESWPVITLPMPEGDTARFAFAEAPVMAPALAARYPEIRTFIGYGVDEPASARFDRTPTGMHAQIRRAGGTVYIDPYYRDDSRLHVSYRRADLVRSHDRFACHLGGHSEEDDGFDDVDLYRPLRANGELHTYRLALAANAQYSQYHGGTTVLALAAMTTTINRVNGIYETELGIRLELVADTDQLIYLAEPDPYTNGDVNAMIVQNQANANAVIGSANYDIGHVFGTSGGGLAALGGVCSVGSKGQGATGVSPPTGDAHAVDYVAHEMGHQFAAQHTFNGINGACGNAGQRVAASAYEPGSGSTIMCYAGLCGADNLQSQSDAYFHHESIRQIQQFIESGGGASCGTVTATGNADPVVDAGSDYVIPKQTPFTVTASGSDPDSDPVTYCWEQRNLGLAAALDDPPNGSGPLFRTWTPTTEASRTFPRWEELRANTTPLGEELPLYNRTIILRVTARDNRTGGGGVAADDVEVEVDATTGPFRVTAPNTGTEVWTDSGLITWDVAGTTGGSVNAATVNIRLSLDGGLTFPYTLAAGTANDGSESVTFTVPPTTTARVMVEAAGSIFFDISDADFVINSEPLVVSLPNGPPASLAPGLPTSFQVEIQELAENLEPGTALLHYRFDGGAFATAPLTHLSGNLYEAVLPRAVCTDEPEFYVSATGDGGSTVTDPETAPADMYAAPVGVIDIVLADDFETDQGWTVSASGGVVDGLWERGVPVNEGYGDPPADYDGSGQCYVTENTATYPSGDVDFGTTTLTSPAFDMSGAGTISYAWWLDDYAPGLLGAEDYLKVECAVDAAGTSWQTLRTYDTAEAAWRTDAIAVGDEIPTSATFRIRFVAADIPPGDNVEAGVDAFDARRFVCYPVGSGDFDVDGDIDLVDFGAMQNCWMQTPLPTGCAPGDLDGNATLNGVDLELFTSLLDGPQ